MTPTDESELTDRQRDVLRLHRDGRNPTEIGKELGISSQGVHGHLRRLRGHGLIEDGAPAAKPAARKRSANERHRGAASAFDPAAAIAAVQQAITQQHTQLDDREAEIDAEIARLRDEKKAIAAARAELSKLTPG